MQLYLFGDESTHTKQQRNVCLKLNYSNKTKVFCTRSYLDLMTERD